MDGILGQLENQAAWDEFLAHRLMKGQGPAITIGRGSVKKPHSVTGINSSLSAIIVGFS